MLPWLFNMVVIELIDSADVTSDKFVDVVKQQMAAKCGQGCLTSSTSTSSTPDIHRNDDEAALIRSALGKSFFKILPIVSRCVSVCV